MKNLILALFLIIPFYLHSQEGKDLTRKEKKELEAQENEEKMKAFYEIIENRQFVVEADQVIAPNGDTFNVSPTINYFACDSSYSTIQLGLNGLIGWNGVGGVTIDGRIDRYVLKEFKPGKPITLEGSINARIGGNAQFVMFLYASGMANITVSGNWGDSVTFQGRLFTLADSKAFKGIPSN